MFNPDWLPAIGKIHAKNLDSWGGNYFSLQRIYGGANNALYKIETIDGDNFACKLCVDDVRDRALREFGSLHAIQAAGADIAPEPLLLDESKSLLPYPAVIYRWIDGDPLQPPLDHVQLETFLDFYHQLHAIQPDIQSTNLPTAWFHWFDFDEYLVEIRELHESFAPWLATQPNGSEHGERLMSLIDHCARTIRLTKVDPGKAVIPLRLARVDPNTANAIWGTDQHLRFVDWEYSGWGDPALDVAELRWHAALQPLGRDNLQWLRASYQSPVRDFAFEERLHIWDVILATRWPHLVLRFLWSLHNGPDRERLSQVKASPTEIHQRLVYYLKLAEDFFENETPA